MNETDDIEGMHHIGLQVNSFVGNLLFQSVFTVERIIAMIPAFAFVIVLLSVPMTLFPWQAHLISLSMHHRDKKDNSRAN